MDFPWLNHGELLNNQRVNLPSSLVKSLARWRELRPPLDISDCECSKRGERLCERQDLTEFRSFQKVRLS